MVEPNIESKEDGQTSEIAKKGKWLQPLDPGPGVCMKTAKKQFKILQLGSNVKQFSRILSLCSRALSIVFSKWAP